MRLLPLLCAFALMGCSANGVAKPIEKNEGKSFADGIFAITNGGNAQLINLTRKADRSQINETDWLNFKALGYEGDPIIYGGRFKKLPLGWKVASQKK